MRSFATVQERLEDWELASPLILGVVKLLLITAMLLNLLGGIWCVPTRACVVVVPCRVLNGHVVSVLSAAFTAAPSPCASESIRTCSLFSLSFSMSVCCWFLVTGRHYIGIQSDFGWLDAYCPDPNQPCMVDRPLQERYVVSVYYVMTTISSVGYGDVTARNTAGMAHVVCCVLCVVCCVLCVVCCVLCVVGCVCCVHCDRY
jgi:hypothetical protein